jgi:hypothetical protein
MNNILTPNVVNSKQLFQILKDAGIELRQGNISQFVKNYGISNPKSVDVEYIDKRTGSANRVSTYKNPKSFYVKPTAKELKKIKEQYDINILKKTDKGPGKIAFDKRNKRAKQLLKTKKYTIAQANEILKSEFPEIKKTGMKTTLQKLAKTIKGIPSGTTGETAAGVVKITKDLEKLNNSEIKNLIKAGNTRLDTLVKKTTKLLGTSDDISTRRIGQLIEAYGGDDRYIKPKKDDLFLRGASKLTEGLGDVTKGRLFGGIGGGLQRMRAESKVAKALGKTRTFFTNLRKRIQERIPGSGYETDEIKNIRSSARFNTAPYSLFVQGIKSDINQEKSKAFDKQTSIYEKRLQEADPKDKPKIAKEYNEKARKFEIEANKNLKSGQLPVRALRISFEEPNKVIKNKFALDTYGDMFDDVYKKHGYSFKVPADVKTIEEVKPFLEGGRGYKQALNLIRAGAPRIFGLPVAAYVGYQMLKPTEVEAAEVKPKDDIIYNPEIGAVVNKETDDKVPQSTILDWAANNPIYVAPIAAAPLLNKSVRSSTKKLLGGLLKTLGTPGIAAGFAGATIKSNLDEGKGIAESVLDPMVGIELLAPDVYKKFGGQGLKGLAGKILNLTPRIAGAMTPVGLGITAIGLGKMGYDAIQKDVQRMKDEGTYKDFLEEQAEFAEMVEGA